MKNKQNLTRSFMVIIAINIFLLIDMIHQIRTTSSQGSLIFLAVTIAIILVSNIVQNVNLIYKIKVKLNYNFNLINSVLIAISLTIGMLATLGIASLVLSIWYELKQKANLEFGPVEPADISVT